MAEVRMAWASCPVPEEFYRIQVDVLRLQAIQRRSLLSVDDAHGIRCYCAGYRTHDPAAKRALILMDVPAGEYPKTIKMTDLKLR